MIASKGGFTAIIRPLLQRGAAVNMTDDTGTSSLHYAAKFGHFEIMDILINNRAAIELRDTVEGININIMLSWRCLLFVSVIMNRSLIGNTFSSLVHNVGFAPIHLAAQFGRKECVKCLLDYGGKVNRRTSKEKVKIAP